MDTGNKTSVAFLLEAGLQRQRIPETLLDPIVRGSGRSFEPEQVDVDRPFGPRRKLEALKHLAQPTKFQAAAPLRLTRIHQ